MPVSAQAHQGVARHPPARRGSGKCAGARSGGSRDLHREVTCTQRCVQRGAGPSGDDVVPTGPVTWSRMAPSPPQKASGEGSDATDEEQQEQTARERGGPDG